MTGIVLYGFDGSTYVRTVRMLLAEKGAHYEQVPVNVLKGEPRQPEHVARHPFGKVPVLDSRWVPHHRSGRYRSIPG